MELQRGTAELYLGHAFRQMLYVADRLGDDRVNDGRSALTPTR
jgi:hypothetical protein